MLSMMTTVSLALCAFLPATAPPKLGRAAVHRAAIAAPARVSAPRAFVGPEDDALDTHNAVAPALYRKTESGLSYKDLETGHGDPIAADAMVSIKFAARILSTGDLIQQGGLTFVRGTGGIDLFDESIDGMRVGGERRVIVPPSATFAVLDDEDIEFTFTVTGIKEGPERALYSAGRAVGGLARLAFFYVLTSSLIDLFLPAASAGGSVAAQNVDAANAWAAQGLSALGLM